MRVALGNQTPPNELMYRAAYQTPSKRQNLRLEQQVEEYMYVRVVVNSSKRIAWTKERKVLDVGDYGHPNPP
jgi:hypothetical protein